MSTVKSNIWGTDVWGIDEGDDAAEFLSKFLQRPVRLLVKDPKSHRPLNVKRIPAENAFSYAPTTAFSDGFRRVLSFGSVAHNLAKFLCKPILSLPIYKSSDA